MSGVAAGRGAVYLGDLLGMIIWMSLVELVENVRRYDGSHWTNDDLCSALVRSERKGDVVSRQIGESKEYAVTDRGWTTANRRIRDRRSGKEEWDRQTRLPFFCREVP